MSSLIAIHKVFLSEVKLSVNVHKGLQESRSFSGESADVESETFFIALLQLQVLMQQIHLTSAATSEGQQSLTDLAQ